MNWQDFILQQLTVHKTRLILVSDPDSLLLQGEILEKIGEMGFQLLQYEDPIEFRYLYEKNFRTFWDREEKKDVHLIVRINWQNFHHLPYDLLKGGKKLSFSLAEIFPELSYPVIASLNSIYWQTLFVAQDIEKPQQLGDKATKDFILRHVFGITVELINKSEDLLAVLLHCHYQDQQIPAMLVGYLIKILRKKNLFTDWDLERIISDRNVFLDFLQERWPVFLDRLANINDESAKEVQRSYNLQFAGPAVLPFEHKSVQAYLDNFFYEGLLQSISHTHSQILKGQWVSVGLKIETRDDPFQQLKATIAAIEKNLPASESHHHVWMGFAYRWARLKQLVYQTSLSETDDLSKKVVSLQQKVDQFFFIWLQNRFSSLFDQPPSPPVMVHHIVRYLLRGIEEKKFKKVALIVIDGLALDQWLTLRDGLLNQKTELQVQEKWVFAWIPTITPVSRQAIFAGKAPSYFPDSIYSTSNEENLWKKRWISAGFKDKQVGFANVIGEMNCLSEIDEVISRTGVKVAALVVRKVDRIMHGMQLGAAGMHNQVAQWVQEPFLKKLFDSLFKHNFEVFLTSDHGNVEATGYGRPSEGSVAEIRGERVRIYSDSKLRDKVKSDFPEAIAWPTIGLPEDFFCLCAPERMAFVPKKEKIVSHGGLSIEELIVPFIHFKVRRDE
jgi:hypothetical protein